MKNKVSFPGLGIEEFTINSVAFTIGKIQIPWYSLIITTGIVLAVLYVWFRFKESGLTIDDLLDFTLAVVPSGVVGARLYYVIFQFDYFYVPGDFGETFLNIIDIPSGGLAIYGGIIAGGLAAVIMAHFKKIKLLKILDFLAPAVMMAQSVGRWGNFTNVEAFGGPTRLPWRMCSPKITRNLYANELINDEEFFEASFGAIGAHPTFLYESLWNLIGFLAIYFIFVRRKKLHKIDGQIFYMYLIWYGLGRFLIEGLRTDSLYLIPGVIRVSQLVALLSFAAGIGLMIFGLVRFFKYGRGEMVLVIPRDKEGKIIKSTSNNQTNDNTKKSKGEKNGKNNKR